MRTIKFRGRHVETGAYVYGLLDVLRSGNYHIFNNSENVEYQILPDSLAQFTEMTDADDKEIYDGDELVIDFKGAAKVFGDGFLVRDLQATRPTAEAKLKVEWRNVRYQLVWRTQNGGVFTGVDLFYLESIKKFVRRCD